MFVGTRVFRCESQVNSMEWLMCLHAFKSIVLKKCGWPRAYFSPYFMSINNWLSVYFSLSYHIFRMTVGRNGFFFCSYVWMFFYGFINRKTAWIAYVSQHCRRFYTFIGNHVKIENSIFIHPCRNIRSNVTLSQAIMWCLRIMNLLAKGKSIDKSISSGLVTGHQYIDHLQIVMLQTSSLTAA